MLNFLITFWYLKSSSKLDDQNLQVKSISDIPVSKILRMLLPSKLTYQISLFAKLAYQISLFAKLAYQISLFAVNLSNLFICKVSL